MIDKVEFLRHYRIADFKDMDEFLDQVAKKKGLVERVRVPIDENVALLVKNKAGKMVKRSEKKLEYHDVPDRDNAARRVIRDFLNNRLSYSAKPPQVEKKDKVQIKKKSKPIQKK